MSDSPFSAEQYQAAADQVQAPPLGTGPDAIDASAATATEVDVAALLRQMQAQQDELTRQVAQLRAGQPAQGEHPLVSTATAARDLIGQHFDRGGKGDRAMIGRLADDLVDASGNAVESGDPSAARDVAAKLTKELNRVHPGPGDHHYFTNALALVGYHYGNAADTVTEAKPSNRPSVSGGAPAKVIAGSVTG